MLSSNPLFMSRVNHVKSKFIELLCAARVNNIVYPSKHFFERVIERNLDEVDVLHMLTPVIREFRVSTYNERTFLVQWRQYGMAASFETGCVSGKRRIVIRTIYDKFREEDYDVTIRI